MVVPLGNLIPFASRQLMPLTPHGSLQGSCYWATNLKKLLKDEKKSSISLMDEKENSGKGSNPAPFGCKRGF